MRGAIAFVILFAAVSTATAEVPVVASRSVELRCKANAASAQGFWEGVVTREGKQWKVNVNIEGSAATVDFVDLDIAGVAFPMFVNGSKVRLEKPQPNGRQPVIFDGEVLVDRFSGLWSGLGVSGSFSLMRGTKPPDLIRDEEVSFQNGEVKLSGRYASSLVDDIGRNFSVAQAHDAVCKMRDILFVCYNDHCIALAVNLIED